ncbi:helix-turn-helix domain-containing protein [Pseudoroseicyclus tamaricis]|uniref:Helix-turn-helix domain-containing protein n=1 Tax=Pseudoroseicyclus tamaricis TaxID=2705421 RepID=A0A6B2JV12_9RHOB|nr:helix-turn-helix domain-containing protein [Pseudoroseicyclus tamaricis]NDV02347.1 helix-turn-helix domain-containing protein [Pseudoroseicyclus tamaricis]
MTDAGALIPAYALYGESRDFPDVLHCERLRDRARPNGWVIAPHRHLGLHQVFLIIDGGGEMELDGERRPVAGGEIISVPRLTVHGFTFEPGIEGYVVSVPNTEMARLTEGEPELARLADAPRRLPAPPLAAQAFTTLHEVRLARQPARGPLLRALVLQILCALAQAEETARPSPSRPRATIAGFEALIREDPEHRSSIAACAAALGLSTSQLTRHCRSATGYSPLAYAQLLLMQEAKRLLAYTREDVAEIGYRLGFDDPAYFSRVFRRVTGQSPSAFRAPFVA